METASLCDNYVMANIIGFLFFVCLLCSLLDHFIFDRVYSSKVNGITFATVLIISMFWCALVYLLKLDFSNNCAVSYALFSVFLLIMIFFIVVNSSYISKSRLDFFPYKFGATLGEKPVQKKLTF